jgi:hypothetical protein
MAIPAILSFVSYIFPLIPAVFDPVAFATIVKRISSVFPSVTDIFPSVMYIFTAIYTVF